MKQKFTKIGNSAGLIFPKSLLEESTVKIGTTVDVSYKEDLGGYFISIPKKQVAQKNSKVSHEFEQWLGTFLKEDAKLLTELAGR